MKNFAPHYVNRSEQIDETEPQIAAYPAMS